MVQIIFRMAPAPQETSPSVAVAEEPQVPTLQLKDDDIVISGLSGLYPQSHNVKEFSEKLYKHVISQQLLPTISSKPELLSILYYLLAL